MNHSRSVLATSALALTLLVPRAEAAFQVVLEVDPPSGASATFTDGDLDGIIDFNTTVGGVFLAQGQVKVTKRNKLLNVLRAGECFGEMAYLQKGAHVRGADVSAMSDCKIITVPTDRLDQASDGCRHHFDRAFMAILVERLTMANVRLSGV